MKHLLLADLLVCVAVSFSKGDSDSGGDEKTPEEKIGAALATSGVPRCADIDSTELLINCCIKKSDGLQGDECMNLFAKVTAGQNIASLKYLPPKEPTEKEIGVLLVKNGVPRCADIDSTELIINCCVKKSDRLQGDACDGLFAKVKAGVDISSLKYMPPPRPELVVGSTAELIKLIDNGVKRCGDSGGSDEDEEDCCVTSAGHLKGPECSKLVSDLKIPARVASQATPAPIPTAWKPHCLQFNGKWFCDANFIQNQLGCHNRLTSRPTTPRLTPPPPTPLTVGPPPPKTGSMIAKMQGKALVKCTYIDQNRNCPRLTANGGCSQVDVWKYCAKSCRC